MSFFFIVLLLILLLQSPHTTHSSLDDLSYNADTKPVLSLLHILNKTKSSYKLVASYGERDVDDAIRCQNFEKYALRRLDQAILMEHERYVRNMITSDVPSNLNVSNCVLLPSRRDFEITKTRSVQVLNLGETKYRKGLFNTHIDHSNHREDFVSYIELFAHLTKTSLRCRESEIECSPSQALRDLVQTLTSSNVSATSSPALGRLCPLSSIPFGHARYLPGRLRWLRREYVTSSASMVGSLGGLAQPPMLVYGWKSQLDFDRIWLGANPIRNFTVGEVVQLRDFEKDGNVGLFVIASFPSERTIRITELPSGIPLSGRLSSLREEVNTEIYVYGCFGCILSGAKASITFSASDKTWSLCGVSSSPHCQLAPSEMIQIKNLRHIGNDGSFRVKSHERDCILLSEITPFECRYGRMEWLKPETSGNTITLLKRNESTATLRFAGSALLSAPSEDTKEISLTPFEFNHPGNFGRFKVLTSRYGHLLSSDTLSSLQHVRVTNENTTSEANVLEFDITEAVPSKLDLSCPYHISEESYVPPLVPFISARCPVNRCRASMDSLCCTNRGNCIDDKCLCDPTWGSEYCAVPNMPCPLGYNKTTCSNHGVCNSMSGQCVCDAGWTGANCSKRAYECPRSCSGHGTCNFESGKCFCEPLWTGIDCFTPSLACPNACSGHGFCDHATGKCECLPTFGGLDCSDCDMPCPLDCSNRGRCLKCEGRCECEAPWSPPSCCDQLCPDDCTDESHGMCVNQTCVCRRAWTGISCAIPKCGPHGQMAADGSCQCVGPYFAAVPGSICDKVGVSKCSCSVYCDNSLTCGYKGQCSSSGQCLCSEGFSGRHCEVPLIPTGEMNWRHYPYADNSKDFGDLAMLRSKALWLLYAGSSLPKGPNRDRFRAVFDACNTSPFSGTELADYATQVMKKGDMGDPSNFLGFNEFLHYEKTHGGESPPDLYKVGCTYAFALYDEDRDGQVTLRELLGVALSRDGLLPPLNCPGPVTERPKDLILVASNCSVSEKASRVRCRTRDVPKVSEGNMVRVGSRTYEAKRIRFRTDALLSRLPKLFPGQQVLQTNGCHSCDDECTKKDSSRCFRAVRENSFVSCDSTLCLTTTKCVCVPKPSQKSNSLREQRTSVYVTTLKNDGCRTCREYCASGEESLRDAQCVSAHGSTDGKYLSCDVKRCGRGLDCTCENKFKTKTKRSGGTSGLTRLSDRDACSSCETHCSSVMAATCEAALLQSGDFSVPCDFTQCDAKRATVLSCMCREPDLMMSSFELDRDYEGPSSVGIEMYLDTLKDNTFSSSSSSSPSSFNPPADMIDPSVLDAITAYSMRPSDLKLRKRWDEVHPVWVKCDTNLDLAWRPDELCKCAMTTPKALLIHSKDQNMIIDPDPKSKRWCEKFPDHEPPAKPGVCSDDTDQTYAGSGKDATSKSCEGRASKTECEKSTSSKSCVWKEDKDGVGTCEESEIESDGTGEDGKGSNGSGSGGSSGGGPGDYDVGKGKVTDRGTTRTGYEGKGFEFGKNQAGKDLGTSTSLDSGDGKNNVGPFAMGTVQDGYPDEYPLDFPNPFEWCDMSNPFFNPFCPTPNPWFNILIKFMIPGAIRPFIDQITNALLKGQEFMIMLTKCMIPPIDGTGPRGGPPGFIEISSRDDAISKGLAEISMSQGQLVPLIKKEIIKSLSAAFTKMMARPIVERVSNAMSIQLHHRLAFSLREQLNASLTHSLHHILGETVGIASGRAVSTALISLLPQRLVHVIGDTLSHTMTRSLTHTLTPALIGTLSQSKQSPERAYYCYYCETHGRFCDKCDRQEEDKMRRALRDAQYYASYYSDYYADFFTVPGGRVGSDDGTVDRYGRKIVKE